MAMITADSFRGFDLRSDELNNRLKAVKKEFGMRRAVSTRSLAGETRTFAEILDQQVEMIVLYYLEVQGIIAKQVRLLRERQVKDFQDMLISLDSIEAYCQRYRDVCAEIVELLVYLERNSIALRRILKRHDALFDQKMGSMYFDTRLASTSHFSQLRQLYHQEGIRAVMGSLRRGFEDLYDARKALIESTGGDFTFTPFTPFSSLELGSVKAKRVPRISFKKKMQSYSNFHALTQERSRTSPLPAQGDGKDGGPAAAGDVELADLRGTNTRTKSSNSLYFLTSPDDDGGDGAEGLAGSTRTRTLSDLEPQLRRISELALRLSKTQTRTTLDFLSSHSALGLEFKMKEIRAEAEDDTSQKREDRGLITHRTSLMLNHVLTLLYLMNQYVVAPTGGDYAARLGMSRAVSGAIIGLTPMAALVSSLLYSMWSNTSFKAPLLFSIVCAIAGNVLYGLALQLQSPLFILLGRLLTGFGGGRVISRRYIADHVSIDDRLLASSQFVSAGALGLALGPLLASLIELSDVSFTWKYGVSGVSGGVVLVQYERVTAPGWIMSVLWLCSFFCVMFMFKEPVLLSRASEKKEEEKQPLLDQNTHSARHHTYGSSSSSSSTGSKKHSAGALPTPTIVHVESGSELWGREDKGLAGTGGSGNFPWSVSPMSTGQQQPAGAEIAKRKSAFYSSSSDHMDENGYALPSGGSAGAMLGAGNSGKGLASSSSKAAPAAVTHYDYSDLPRLAAQLEQQQQSQQSSCWAHISSEVHTVLWLYVINKAGQELTVSSMPLLLKQMFGWGAEGVGYYMALVGSLVLPTNVLVNYMFRYSEERELVVKLTGFAVLGVGCILHILHGQHYSIMQYVVGTALIFTSLNALEGVIMSLLAKIISPELAQGTFNSGLLATEAGTFGRVVGDMLITMWGEHSQAGALVNELFLPLGICLISTVVLVYRCYDRLVD